MPSNLDKMSPGLIHLTRIHSVRSSDSSGHGFDSLDSSFTDDHIDDRSWSWIYLKSEFTGKDSEKLFHKYQARLQHNFFMVLLLLNISFNLIAIAIYLWDKQVNTFPGEALMRGSALIVYFAFLILTCLEEQWLRPRFARIVAALTVLVAMIVSEHGGALFAVTGDKTVYPLQRIRPTFSIILTNHVFLPFPSRIYACIGTLVIVSLELLLTIISRAQSDCASTSIIRYAVADTIFYSLGAFIGFFLTFLLEIANRKAFLDHRSCVESKFKLDYEKEQQDSLLSSCLPRHLMDRVRNDIKLVIERKERSQRSRQKPFNELYVEKYKNVTILYADIVNSMLLAAKLSPNDLVETLNTLFGRFDESSERNDCLRIKLLGDCYYCVSGVPEYVENHALNCVRMGLEMIAIIKSVREETQVDVDMRIGVHSGMVLSGLLGLHKWQYDIFSKDSMIANEMEHTGVPGCVHVTQATLDLIPETERREFCIEERKHENGESTYLITPRVLPYNIRTSYGYRNGRQVFKNSVSMDSLTIANLQRTVLVESLQKYREMVKYVNDFLADTIDEMPLGKKALWLRQADINPIFLSFTQAFTKRYGTNLFQMERQFAIQTDPLFRYYLYCSGLICLSMVAIKTIIPNMPISSKLYWTFFVTVVIITGSLTYTFWTRQQLKYLVRVMIWFVITVWLLLCGTLDMIREDCMKDQKTTSLADCAFTWYYTFCLILALTSISLFLRINMWFKLALNLSALLIYITLSRLDCSVISILDSRTKWKYLAYESDLGHIYYILTVSIILHVIDRQIEYILRLGFQWTTRLEVERREALVMGEINRILLDNILPQHVAQRFLYSSFNGAQRYYHEAYDSIAVIFASIPNYAQFYTETNINEEGLKCLLLLNEIICDFDKLLADPSFARIEKIKTIGSTYMAASGLHPGRGSTDSDSSLEELNLNVLELVNFGTALMEALARINKDALQEFKLRIGISSGPVIAGVVGALKPQYDIWGDTVNVASRMDSYGVIGRINVTESVANILMQCSTLELECRGPVLIKGKGEMVTYLVKTPFDS
ncbi:adenylate cyclase type 2 [Tetranychus urticae]|nr:adenylate cyclase type 2 [Tetranychus urticae]